MTEKVRYCIADNNILINIYSSFPQSSILAKQEEERKDERKEGRKEGDSPSTLIFQ